MSRSILSPCVAIPLLLLLMAALTGPHVFGDPLWGDELRTWRDGIAKPLADVLMWRHNADHAPLGHLLARMGASLFGVEHAWSLRIGSWLCGMACVPAIWWMGRTITGSNAAGLLMALMLIVDPTASHAATTARMYAVLLLAGTLSIGLTSSLLIDPDRPALRSATLAAVLAVGLWSHSQIYAILAPLLVLSVVCLVVNGIRRRVLDRSAVSILLAALAGILLGIQGVLKLVGRRDADPLDAEKAARPFAQLEDATIALTGANWITAVVILSALVGFVLIAKKRNARVAWLLGGIVGMAMLNLLIAAKYRPVGFARYLTIAQPTLWAGVAMSLVTFIAEFLKARASSSSTPRQTTMSGALAMVGTIGFVGLSIFQLTRTLADAPHPAAAQFLEACRSVRQDEHVLFVPRSPHMMYAQYYGVRHDDALFEALANHVTTPRERGKRPKPTTQQTGRIEGSEPITIVGVIPARGSKHKTAEDPLVLVETLARLRGLNMPQIVIPDGTLRVIVVRFAQDGRIEVSDPHAP